MHEDKELTIFMFFLSGIAIFFFILIIAIDHFRPHDMNGRPIHQECSGICP